MNAENIDLKEIQNQGEKLKELLWCFLENWYPPEYGQVAAIKSSMNNLLDAIDSLEGDPNE